MNKVLITGGKGYLGARFCDYFSSFSNFEVYVSSRTTNELIEVPSVKIIKVNTNKDDLIHLLKDIDIVIHLAALDALESKKEPQEAINVNIGDTFKWLEAASSAEVSQFIYFSTVHVYGNSLQGIIDEKTLTRPAHPYSITHKCAEDYVLEYGNRNNFKSHVIRLSNSIGYSIGILRQENLLVPDLCKNAINKNRITLKSDPKIEIDFITIEDVCRAITFLIESSKKYDNGIYNLSSGECMTLLEMAEKIQFECNALLSIKPEIELLFNDENALKKPKKTSFTINNNKFIEKGFQLKNDYSREIKELLKYFKAKENND